MVSLYDYLGRAAGAELGKQVAEYAKIRNQRFETRTVVNPRYSGEIMLYEKTFLDEFFKAKSVIGTNRSQNNTFQSYIL
jgi:hypothetical protein